jgi:branched-subunit amino acid aminotransferase/4-amino-4-deoxychorismate lyase
MAAVEAILADVAWVDGQYVPRAELTVPVGDAGFVLGATVTEQLRTFHGRPFLVEEHLARLGESAALVGIELPLPLADVASAAAHVAAHNHSRAAADAVAPGPDLGIVIFLTPGDVPAQHGGRSGRARMALHTFPLAFSMWAAAYAHGLALRSVSVRQVPEACWPLRAKVRSRLHYFLADREAHAAEPGARAVLAHLDGRISETSTANVAVVRGGAIVAPLPTDALPGVSLAYVRRLAETLGIAWREESLRAADLAAADEILLTSTPNCILPATRFDGRPVGDARPGPVFRALMAAWSAAVGLDIAAQARAGAASAPLRPATAATPTGQLPDASSDP